MRSTYLALLGGAMLATLVACGDDETGGTSTTGAGNSSNGGSGNTGGDSGGSGNSGGTGNSGGDGGDGNSGGDGGTGGGSGGGSNAQSFCADYEDICGFGDPGYFADEAACLAGYDGFDGAQQACVEQHLGLADGGDLATHCPHAAGAPPCN